MSSYHAEMKALTTLSRLLDKYDAWTGRELLARRDEMSEEDKDDLDAALRHLDGQARRVAV